MRSGRIPLCMMILCVAPGVTGRAAAEQAVLDAARDNSIFQDTSNYRSNGIGEGLFSGATITGELRRALIAFDVASVVPAGATITAVQLQLNLSQTRGGTHLSALHRLTSEWGEGNSNSDIRGGGQGAPAAQNDATWAHTFYDGETWATPGGDFVPQASASASVTDLGWITWGSTPQMVADVQTWLDTPQDNFGWILLTAEATSGGAKRFDSRESVSPGNPPALLVTYAGTAVASGTWSATKALFR